MKLPLIVRAGDGEIYHVLHFDRGFAIAVNPRSLNIEELDLRDITALSEDEYDSLNGPNICENCRFFEKSKGTKDKFGFCMRFPPQMIEFEGGDLSPVWPEVTPSNRCGEFKS